MNERPIEYSFALQMLAMSGAINLLDVGTGRTAFPAIIESCKIQVRSIDSSTVNIKKNPYVKPLHDDILNPTKVRPGFDFITCLSVLEHIPKYLTAVKNMASLLNLGGLLVMTFPFKADEYVPNAYKLPNAGYGQKSTAICQQFSNANLAEFERIGMKLLVAQYWQIFTGKYWTEGKRLVFPIQVKIDYPHHLACVAYKKIRSA